MPSRSRDSVQTKGAILAAARLLFGAAGYDRTTIRAVAQQAAVDPALVMHYFGSKDGLFSAAAQLDLHLPDLTHVPADRLADVLVPAFLATWTPEGPFLGLLRAAASNELAATALLAVFVEQVAPALGAVAPDRPRERAAMLGSQVLGLAVGRHIMNIPALADMTEAELIQWLRPVFTHYLTDVPGTAS